MPPLVYDLDLTLVHYFPSNFLDRFPTSVFDDDSEDENPPLPAHFPLVAPTQLLTQWVRSTCEATGDLAGDPRDQCRTHSQFQQASSLLGQVLKNHDLKTFIEASDHVDCNVAMDKEYRSLMANNT